MRDFHTVSRFGKSYYARRLSCWHLQLIRTLHRLVPEAPLHSTFKGKLTKPY